MRRLTFNLRLLMLLAAAISVGLSGLVYWSNQTAALRVTSNCPDCGIFLDDRRIGVGQALLSRKQAYQLGIVRIPSEFTSRHDGVYLSDCVRSDGSVPVLWISPGPATEVNLIESRHGLQQARVLIESSQTGPGRCDLIARLPKRDFGKFKACIALVKQDQTIGRNSATTRLRLRVLFTQQQCQELGIDTSKGISVGVNAISLLDGKAFPYHWNYQLSLRQTQWYDIDLPRRSPEEDFVFFGRICDSTGRVLNSAEYGSVSGVPIEITTSLDDQQ